MCQVCCLNPEVKIYNVDAQVVSVELSVDLVPTFLSWDTMIPFGSAEDIVPSHVRSSRIKWRSLSSVLSMHDIPLLFRSCLYDSTICEVYSLLTCDSANGPADD